MADEILSILGPALSGIIFFGIMFGFAFFIKNNLFKHMREKFETNEEMPNGAFRVGNFWQGSTREYHRAFKLAEQGKALFFGCRTLRFKLKIPFSEIEEAKMKSAFFGQIIIKIKFKDSKLRPVTMAIPKKHLDKLPNFIKFSGAEIEDSKTINSTSSEHLAKKGSQSIYLKSTPVDAVRKAILVIVLIAAAVTLYAYYG